MSFRLHINLYDVHMIGSIDRGKPNAVKQMLWTYRSFRDTTLLLIYYPDVLALIRAVGSDSADERIPAFWFDDLFALYFTFRQQTSALNFSLFIFSSFFRAIACRFAASLQIEHIYQWFDFLFISCSLFFAFSFNSCSKIRTKFNQNYALICVTLME